jgi:ribonuclease HI
MATLPHSHPITKMYQKSSKHRVKRHRAPLHQLTSAYNIIHEDFETVTMAGRNPALMGKRPFRTDIPDNKDSSKEKDKQVPENMKIYTDGSAHNGKVGAAAILTRNGKTEKILHYHLGSAEEHTVFEVELAGLLMGLHMIEANKKGNTSFSIGVDNQAAIKVLSSRFDKPGHYLAAEAFRTAERIRKKKGKKYSLTFRWTAGHSGIPGNEEADEEAKKAAEGKSTDAAKLPKLLRKRLKISKSATIASAASERKKTWRREWLASLQYAKFKHFNSTLPSRKFIKLISNTKISRADASKIFQMRSDMPR